MMRPGDKFESYRRLAAALAQLDTDWHLTIVGDGSERKNVETLFEPFTDQVTFLGQVDDTTEKERIYQDADLFVWPGVGEGVGMVYLEAQAAGLSVVAEAHAAPAELVAAKCAPVGDAEAFGNAISALAVPSTYREASSTAHAHVLENHSLDAAARILRHHLPDLLQ